MSHSRVDVCWIGRRPGDLALGLFEPDTDLVEAYFVPSGEFVVFLYWTEDIGSNSRIERSGGYKRTESPGGCQV